MSIKDFIIETEDKYNASLRVMSASEVLLQRTTGIDWEKEFRRQGYVSVKKHRGKVSDEIIDWCKNTFGEDHYVVFYRSSGALFTFWFDKPQNATLFRIKWS